MQSTRYRLQKQKLGASVLAAVFLGAVFLPDLTYARHVNVNKNVNVNRNVSHRTVNVNRNVNVNRHVDVDVYHRYGHGYYNPIATAAAVTATAVVTAAVVGSIVYSIPPSCSIVQIGAMVYQQCGSTWYQPQYYGSSVQYIVVNPPR